MHTHMNRPNISLDWVLSDWAHFTVLRLIFICIVQNHKCHEVMFAASILKHTIVTD